MISVERFYTLVTNLLLRPISVNSLGYNPSSTTSIQNFCGIVDTEFLQSGFNLGRCIWSAEEPLQLEDLEDLQYYQVPRPNRFSFPANTCEVYDDPGSVYANPPLFSHLYHQNIHIFANSEKSKLKKDWLKQFPMYDWYFFYHGFASLDWFRDFKYLDYSEVQIDKVFISLNHILENKRNYRVYMMSLMEEHNLNPYGYISSPLLSDKFIKQNILLNKNSNLSIHAKKHVAKYLLPKAESKILDNCDFSNASADISPFMFKALWTVVTETVYYDEKLHLTEKIFKPIVAKRPFILAAAPGNLEYLKSYGFQTFDRWIDESYDHEPDPDKRLEMIIAELKKLCTLSIPDLHRMHLDMREILEYNHHHFFNNFKKIIVEELVDNYEKILKRYNFDLSERFQIPLDHINFAKAKQILLN